MQIFKFLPMQMLPKMDKEKSFTIIYADILIFAKFCQLMPMLPKMEKEKLFTIIYADILIFANLCQCFANLCQCCLKWKKRNYLQ